MAWTDQAATAAEVTALQTFRDLFAEEALRPGEKISVGSLTVMFTDLEGSSKIYRELGDARAFGSVMDYFAILRECVAAEGGSMVKTIGDAVMGVFPRPASAIRALVRAQAALHSPSFDAPYMSLKSAVHAGPCIAVTLEGQLDYFGALINNASRMVEHSADGTIIISDSVRNDPETRDLLLDSFNGLHVSPFVPDHLEDELTDLRLWAVRSAS